MRDNEMPVMIDPPLVNAYQAIDLCIHYLAMAATYFEAVPDDGNETLNEEINEQIKDEGVRNGALLWADFMLRHHENLKETQVYPQVYSPPSRLEDNEE